MVVFDSDSEREARFVRIVADTERHIRGYIAGLGVHPDEVDDVAQDVYMSFHRAMERRPPEVEPIRWLKGIARNHCMDHFRRSKREAAREREFLATALSGAAESSRLAPGEAMFKALRDCLQELKGRSKRLIVGKYMESRSCDALAEAEGMKSGAVRVALLRTRRLLRECITRKVPIYARD
jgi:RNA polymerase sigma-70 factor (ECF subfamily)